MYIGSRQRRLQYHDADSDERSSEMPQDFWCLWLAHCKFIVRENRSEILDVRAYRLVWVVKI